MHRFLQLACLMWLLILVAHAAALTTDLQEPAVARKVAIAVAPQVYRLESRQPQQSAGSSCSDEGQWNCMTSSWQRCAAGRWSVVMPCAKGTTCAPAGLTRDLRIQHDGSVNKNGGPPTTSLGAAPRGWDARMRMLGLVAGWLWCFS